MNPRPAGQRRWPTRLRRGEERAAASLGLAGGEITGPDPNESTAGGPVPQVDYGPESDEGSPQPGGERELLAAAAAGNPEAVRWLLDEVAPVVFGFLFARVGGDDSAAEDLLQETLLEAVRGASAFRAEASASTWMCAIARRRLARYYESERKAEMARRSLSLVHDGPGATGPATTFSNVKTRW